jgi:hypothetical protein
MRHARYALLMALLALGCAPVPGQSPPAATFQLGEAAGVSPGDETAFTDASGQRYSLQSLGVSTLLVRYNRRLRGKASCWRQESTAAPCQRSTAAARLA